MLASLKLQFRTWLFRPRIETGPVTLNQRRIYILPTRQGLGFALTLTLMLLGDINYNLSLGYVLTFLLATMALMNMLYAFRNMARLEIRAGHADSVFAGGSAQFLFYFHNNGELERHCLRLHDDHDHGITFDLPRQASSQIRLAIPASRRGWLTTGRLTLHTTYPLGLFYAWTYFEFDSRCLVYPEPAAPMPLPSSQQEQGNANIGGAGDEEYTGLRGYMPGDPMQRIAWKAAARERGLQVKQFLSLQGQELWLDWNIVPATHPETRLSILTRWVIDAEARGAVYALRLPDIELPPDQGKRHRDDCLRALALTGLEGGRK